jgi:GNAT superfamily N-acetyltransferase
VTDIVIKPMRYGAPVARALVAAAMADLGQRYGGSGDDTPVEATEFDPPDGAFMVAYVDGQPAGCGAWRAHGDGDQVAEVKRMYTEPSFRGRGVARAVLTALEDSARENGRRRIILETGARQPEAIQLYEKSGYDRITNFGFYREEPDAVSFGRDL